MAKLELKVLEGCRREPAFRAQCRPCNTQQHRVGYRRLAAFRQHLLLNPTSGVGLLGGPAEGRVHDPDPPRAGLPTEFDQRGNHPGVRRRRVLEGVVGHADIWFDDDVVACGHKAADPAQGGDRVASEVSRLATPHRHEIGELLQRRRGRFGGPR